MNSTGCPAPAGIKTITPPPGARLHDWRKEDDMNKSDEAVKRLMETFNCAQAILSTYGPELGLDREHSLKVAAAFGGGIAGMGETCGVVSGALMAIGLAYGKTRADDRGAGEATQKAAHTFLETLQAAKLHPPLQRAPRLRRGHPGRPEVHERT